MAFLASIRGRLILLVLTLLAPTVVLVLSTAQHNRELQLAQARQQLLTVVQEASDDLEEAIRDARSLYFALNLVPAVRELAEPECSRVLAEARGRVPVYTNIVATDRKGQGRCSALPGGAQGTSIADRPYFEKLLASGALVVDRPVLGRVSGRPALPIAGPLKNAQGEIVGALVLPPDLTTFGEHIARFHLIPGLVFHLWDGSGQLLFRYPDAEQLTGKSFADLPLVRHAAASGGAGVIDAIGFDGIKRVIAYNAPSGEYASTGLYIGVTVPAKTLYALPDATLRQALWSTLLIALLGVMAAWLLGSRLIWQQIERITAAARRLASGQARVRIGAPYPGGELGELARTFDAMAETAENRLDEISRINDELEARVLERTARLEASEQQLRGILESAADAFVIVDAAGTIVMVNAQALRLFGYTREEMQGLPVDELLPEALRAGHRQQRDHYHLEKPAVKPMSARQGLQARRKDGSNFCAGISLSTFETPQGRLVSAVVRDITQTVIDERELKRVNRTLRVLSLCNEALVRAENEHDLLAAICRQIVEAGGYRLAWVGFALHDAARSILPAAFFGEAGYIEQLHLSWADVERGRGPVGTAVREARPVVVRDIRSTPEFRPWLAAAEEHGFRSVIALPLLGRKGVFGTLALYSAEPDVFDAEEVKLLAELADDLAFGIASLREAAARERVEHELDYRVSFDTLTGLPNRAVFVDRVEQAIVHAGRSGRQLAVMHLDLDRFKMINDNFGRSAGDRVLREMARRLRDALREGDTVARLSVDEFGILIGDLAQTEDVLPLAQKLLQTVALPVAHDGEAGAVELFVTGSAGISIHPRDGDSAERLLKGADVAMHSAKSLGGNVFHFFAEEMNARVSTRIVLDGALRRALEHGELQVYYQPKVSLSSGSVVGAEALVRWPHPELGMISPVEFIPLAEETGLIVPLGEWVLQTVCRQLRLWEDRHLPVLPVAINLSARQFMQHDLLEVIRRVLAGQGLAPQLLEVEITESTAMINVEKAVGILRDLRALGIRVSLDDFGTGYSSLSYLKRFPVDHLKIDRAFVRDITSDPDDALICTAVIGLAHNLNMSVIAEGVETEGQMNYLRQHHCDEMQGYHFSRPIPADEYAALLATGRRLSFAAASDGERTLLLVDDEENVLSALKRLLRRGGYRILSAGSAAEGFELLATNDVQVIISDQRMPLMSGTAFLRRVKDLYPDTVRLVLSGYTELSSVTEAINQGAIYKFLTKPWDEDDLREKVRDAFRHYDAQKEKRRAAPDRP